MHQSTAASRKFGRKRKAVQALASPFIIATNQDTIKPDATSRILIRHHVMKGRNRKDASSQRSTPRSWVNQGREFQPKWLRGCLASPLRLQINDPGLPVTGLKHNIEPCMVQLIRYCKNIEIYFLLVDKSANIKSLGLVISVMTRAMYPAQCCINSAKEENDWLEELISDATYFEVVLHTAQIYFDTVKSRIYGPSAMRHMNRAMFLLRNKLGCGHEAIADDSTVFTIMTIAMASEIFGDLEAAKKHLEGLYQVLHARGGIGTLSHSRFLQFKCVRFVSRWILQFIVPPY